MAQIEPQKSGQLSEVLPKIPGVLKALATRSLTLQSDGLSHEFRRLPLPKLLNWLLLEVSHRFKSEIPWGWPTHLMAEATNRCNLRCRLCPVSLGLDRPIGDMTLELFSQVMDDVGAYVFLLYLFGWGEPFLNPVSFEIIRVARQHGIKVLAASNGHPLAREDNARRLVESGLDTLIVALDGITQKTYTRYRERGDLETVLQGIRNVVAQKRLQYSPVPRITISLMVMRHNETEIPRLLELCRSLGVEALTLKKLDCNIRDTDPESRLAAQHLFRDMIPQNPRYQRFRYTRAGEPLRLRDNPCKHPWNHPMITWDGVVTSCCMDAFAHQVLGDLRVESLRTIWRGPAARRFRRQFRQDWRQLPLCRKCTYGYAGGNTGREQIAETIFFP